MNEEELKSFTNHLGFQERAYALRARKWRKIGIALTVTVVFFLCGFVIWYGGRGFNDLVKESLSTTCAGENDEKFEITNELQKVTMSGNNLLVLPTTTKNAVLVKTENEPLNDKWPLTLLILFKGIFVLAGLGVAALTLHVITQNHNE